jgi:hypothetical protein
MKKLVVLLLSISSTAFAADEVDKKDSEKQRLATALAQNASATVYKGVDMKKYDCLIQTMLMNKEKCLVSFEIDGQPKDYLASAEVVADWAAGQDAPMHGLTIKVYKDELIRIDDKDGKNISRKMDFSK